MNMMTVLDKHFYQLPVVKILFAPFFYDSNVFIIRRSHRIAQQCIFNDYRGFDTIIYLELGRKLKLIPILCMERRNSTCY